MTRNELVAITQPHGWVVASHFVTGVVLLRRHRGLSRRDLLNVLSLADLKAVPGDMPNTVCVHNIEFGSHHSPRH